MQGAVLVPCRGCRNGSRIVVCNRGLTAPQHVSALGLHRLPSLEQTPGPSLLSSLDRDQGRKLVGFGTSHVSRFGAFSCKDKGCLTSDLGGV